MEKRKLRVGVVGLGHQSLDDHIPAVKSCPDTELVAVVEVDRDKLKSFLKENKGVKGYSTIDGLVKDQKVDFIIIAVPHHLHYDITKKALEYKIHVLKEKPFAVSLAQAKELKRLAEKNGVVISVTMQRRFNPIYSTFFQLIDKIGNPFFIQAQYSFYTDAPHDGWRGKRSLSGGGCLIDMGYHMVDLFMWYFGLPDEVFADVSYAAKEGMHYDAEDTALVTFRYRVRNIFGSLLVSRVIPPKQEFLDVYGTRGIIHIERGKIQRSLSNGQVCESLIRENKWPSAARDQLEYFVKVVHGEKENIGSPDFHFNHLAFIEAAYKSAESQKDINPSSLLI